MLATSAHGDAFVANANTSGRYAGLFGGNAFVQGTFTVAPGFAKSATVLGRDGDLRRLYCMESPEAYFEDFGEDTLPSERELGCGVRTHCPR
jgi:hypothetical protein